MRKFVFGCILTLAGAIGGSGWLIASAVVSGTGHPNLLETFPIWGTGCVDSYVTVGYFIVMMIGLVIALCNIRS